MIDERKARDDATGTRRYRARQSGILQPSRADDNAKSYPSKPSLVFFGNERLASGLPLIEPVVLPTLIEAGYEVAAVVANHGQGRSRAKRPLEIAEVAKKHSVPLHLPAKTTDIKDELAGYGAEAAVLVAYGRIIPQSIIDIFPKGIINIHPSLLSQYRGPTPVEQAILDGAEQTGVSLMKLTAEMDAGPVYVQQTIDLRGDETKDELADTLLRMGSSLLIQHLPGILAEMLSASLQNQDQATYTKLLSKAEGLLDFKNPAERLERQVRAYAGFPKSHAKLHGHEVVVTKARLAKAADDGQLVIKANPGWLEIIELTAPSGRIMSGADFLRGYRQN